MNWLYITLGIVGFVLFLLLALTLVCYFKVFYQRHHKKENHYSLPDSPHFNENRDKMFALIAEMDAEPFERVYTVSKDGLRLSARYYHVQDGAPLQIQVPGYRGTSVRDFCGGNKLARRYGFNTLLLDLRCHGESQGHTITFGVRERDDLLCWINYALERFGKDTEIWLAGVSMGAATVLMTLDSTYGKLPTNVRGAIADCPYDTPSDIIAESCKKLHLSPKFMMPFIRLAARVFGGFDLDGASALKAVQNTDTPILLIHGEEDDIVPCDMSRKIYENCHGYAELHTFAGAGHGLSYIKDYDRYETTVREFVSKVTSEQITKTPLAHEM